MDPPKPASKTKKALCVVLGSCLCVLIAWMYLGNININTNIAGTIRYHVSRLNLWKSSNQTKSLDDINFRKKLERFAFNLTNGLLFENYTLPQPNCEGKLLVYECSRGLCGGLGDREKGIMSSFLLAMLTGRTFVIHHRKPCDIKQFLEPNVYNWSKCAAAAGNARKKGHRSVGFIDGMGNAFPKNFSKLKPGDLWNEHVVTIRINVNMYKRIIYHPNIPSKLPWLLSTPMEVVVTRLMRGLFKPEPSLDKHVQGLLYNNTLNGTRQLVGVHIRSMFLDKNLDIPVFFKYLEQFTDKDKYTMYVACDKPEIRDKARKAFKNFMNVNRKIANIDHNNDCSTVYNAVFEQQVLSRADVMVMPYSGFSRISAFIRGRSDNIHYYIRKKKNAARTDPDGHFEKVELKDFL